MAVRKPDKIKKLSPTEYEVGSATSANKTYLVTLDGDLGTHRCTCAAWAIKRNRNGGLGAPSHCKHIQAVIKLPENDQNAAREKLLANLRDLERG